MINDSLTFSLAAFELLKRIEALFLHPYDDQTGNHIRNWCIGATIGYGHLISQSEWPKYARRITEIEAVDLLINDLQPFEKTIKQAVNVPLSQQQFDALLLLVFNIGGGNFKKSSVLKLINDPRAVTPYPTLDKAWLAWHKTQGKISNGLTNRRNCELNIFKHGVYAHW